MSTALDRARAVEAAFVGIGSYGRGTSRLITEAMQLDAEEEAQFIAQGPVGDLCGHYFDAAGHPLGEPSSHRVIGLSLEELRRLPLVVGLAAGAERRPGVLAALRYGEHSTCSSSTRPSRSAWWRRPANRHP